MTVLADKREALVRAVGISGMAAHGAGFARVVRVYLDRHRSLHQGFVGDHAMQLRKGPLRVGSIGFSPLFTGLFAPASPGSFADVSQVFQPDQAVGVLGHDAFTYDMIGVGFQPSLSPADHRQTADRRTSAFVLKALSQSRIMVGLGDNALAWMKCARPRRIAGHGQVAHPDIHPDDAHLRLGRGVDHLYLKGDQQVKLLAGFVIPEFRSPDGCTLLDEGDMRVIARIGQDDPPEKRQQTHPAVRLEAVVMIHRSVRPAARIVLTSLFVVR